MANEQLQQSVGESRMLSVATLRTTSSDNVAATIRWILAILFVMTGVMKLAVPMLGDAFSGQLIAASLPFYELSRWSVPLVEIGAGVLLAVGFYGRVQAGVVIGVMAVATYVHLVVTDPALFPLQPTQPIIPLAVIVVSLYVVWKGPGAGSMDLKYRVQTRG
jgi:uncharacterized membrane protein YphA (DoxX/SURF4 family)